MERAAIDDGAHIPLLKVQAPETGFKRVTLSRLQSSGSCSLHSSWHEAPAAAFGQRSRVGIRKR